MYLTMYIPMFMHAYYVVPRLMSIYLKRIIGIPTNWFDIICHILDMIPVALPQHRAGAGLTSPGSQFQELPIVQ